MRDLAFVITSKIFMSDDVILERKIKVTEIYYIVEGTAKKFNKRNKSIGVLS